MERNELFIYAKERRGIICLFLKIFTPFNSKNIFWTGIKFEVSIDYLLKDSVEPHRDNKEGYYVSREMADGFLLQERKVSKYVSFGLSLLILSTVPYLVFKQVLAIYTLLIMIIAVLGSGAIVTGLIAAEDKYKVLKKEALVFDQHHHKELAIKYKDMKRRYTAVLVTGVCSIVAGGIPFFFWKENTSSQASSSLCCFDSYWCLHFNSHLADKGGLSNHGEK
ncbi:hypothetical protein [Bacillus sp. S10C12M]|uniref:hypothetical protein n=1 Tax=Bacillus sp. S10C12M TaxID=2918906 RepID=UPI0022803C71|nr:hypothetical protein [Bacillus sp. S10C12M]